MDDTRPLNGLTPSIPEAAGLRESARGENDLEDHGGEGGGYRRMHSQPAEEETALERRRPSSRRLAVDQEPSDLVQALDRLRTTHEMGHVDEDRIRALRGVKHYRDDPQTTKHFRADPDRVPSTRHYRRGTAAYRQEQPPAVPSSPDMVELPPAEGDLGDEDDDFDEFPMHDDV